MDGGSVRIWRVRRPASLRAFCGRRLSFPAAVCPENAGRDRKASKGGGKVGGQKANWRQASKDGGILKWCMLRISGIFAASFLNFTPPRSVLRGTRASEADLRRRGQGTEGEEHGFGNLVFMSGPQRIASVPRQTE